MRLRILLLLVASVLSIPAGKASIYFSSNSDAGNQIVAVERNPVTGLLGNYTLFATGGNGATAVNGAQAHAIAGTKRHLYVVNSGSDTFTTFAIRRNGFLDLLTTTPSGGHRPVSIALSGRRLFVANQGVTSESLAGSVQGFGVTTIGVPYIAGNATTYTAGESPSDVFFSRNGQRVFVLCTEGNTLDSYKLRRDGGLSETRDRLVLDGSPVGGSPMPLLPSGGAVALIKGVSSSVISFQSNAANRLFEISSAVISTAVDPCWVTTSRSGRTLWTSNFEPTTLSQVQVFRGGALTYKNDTPATAGPGSLDIEVSPCGRFLYRLRAFNSDGSGAPHPYPVLEVFRIQSNSLYGGLYLIQSKEIGEIALRSAACTGLFIP